MEKFIHDNQELNGRKHSNVTFAQLDASKIPYPSESFDFVFSNWLLMYLGDNEVHQFAVDSLRWVMLNSLYVILSLDRTCTYKLVLCSEYE